MMTKKAEDEKDDQMKEAVFEITLDSIAIQGHVLDGDCGQYVFIVLYEREEPKLDGEPDTRPIH